MIRMKIGIRYDGLGIKGVLQVRVTSIYSSRCGGTRKRHFKS